MDRNATAIEHARQVLRDQSEAILSAAERLDAGAFSTALQLVLDARGKIVLTGSGKSGIAARKIAATLTSTGTAAVFLHPVDALHGDLGILTSEDVVIAISNSGETPEILSLLVHLKQRGVRVVSILGQTDSTIARNSDAVLDASVDREAGPLQVAPTTSTTVATVVGDALAMALMDAKGVTVEQFALNHPGGTLGKRLTLRVRDLMHSGDEHPVVAATDTLMAALDRITRGGLGAVSVVDQTGRLTGLITDGDVRRAFQSIDPSDLKTTTAGEVMTKDPAVASPDLLAYDALRLMEDRPSQISVMPVVEDDVAVGLLRLHDIVRAGLR